MVVDNRILRKYTYFKIFLKINMIGKLVFYLIIRKFNISIKYHAGMNHSKTKITIPFVESCESSSHEN